MPPIPQPKLRSSCTPCGTTKTKCDRRRPVCVRCSTLKIDCVYEVSRQNGKPRRKRIPLNSRGRRDMENRETRELRGRGGDYVDGISSAEGDEGMGNPNANSNAITIAPSRSHLPTLLPDFQTNVEMDSMVLHDPQSQFPISGDSHPEPCSWNLSPPSALLSLSEPLFSSSFPFPIPLSPTPNDSSNLYASTTHPDPPHSCPLTSYEILRDLICPSPTLHAPSHNSPTVSAHVDEVLRFNAEAVRKLEEVLKCRRGCASPHRAMVHASCVSRVLIWYQQAGGLGEDGDLQTPDRVFANMSGDLSEESSSTTSTTTVASSGRIEEDNGVPVSLVEATGFEISEVPVSIGSFEVGDWKMREEIRVQMVLREVGKMDGLLGLFVDGRGEELYASLGGWLKGEQERTIRGLKKRLEGLRGVKGRDYMDGD